MEITNGVSTSLGTKTGTINAPIQLDAFLDENKKNLDEDWHGGFEQLTTTPAGGAISTGNDVTFSKGIGKILLVLNAGTDVSGSITVTGTSVDRDTGVQTGSDTEVISITSLTTDSSTTDDGGNTVMDFLNACLTIKWFVGAITLSTTDVDLSDMDVFHLSFEQFNDKQNITIDAFDVSFKLTNTAGEFYAHLYKVAVTDTNLVAISSISDLELNAAASTVNTFRIRDGNIATTIDGTIEGIFADLHFHPDAQTHFENFTMTLWASETLTVTVT